jgi:hypothetical protein
MSTFTKKFSIASISRTIKTGAFQPFILSLCKTMNTLCAGSTMGARIRRKEMLELLKTSHKTLAGQCKQMGDIEAFAARDGAIATSLKSVEEKASEAKEGEE